MSERRDEDEFERRLDEVAESLRDVADQISALRDYVPRPAVGDPQSEPSEPAAHRAAREVDVPPARGTPAYRPPTASHSPRRPPESARTEESVETPEATGPTPAATDSQPNPEPLAADMPEEADESPGFRVENWIDKIGIALVLLGVAFLYQLSVEMGLITPPIKVLLGGVVSTILLGVGLKIREDRGGLAQIMMGGASAGYYLSVFAASQLYGLISDPVALGATLGVAAGTFGLAIREDTPALTVVGAIGAFATPFFLEATSAGQLLAFNAIIVAGMTSVYAYKGWTALLLTYASGAWLVVLYAISLHLGDTFTVAADAARSADILAQIGLTVVWLATGVVPVVRSWMRSRASGQVELESGSFDTLMIFGLALLGPVLYQVAAHILWDWSDITWVVFDVTWALAAGLLAWRLAEIDSELFAAAFRFVALMFVTVALFEFFEDQWLATALAIEGAAVCHTGRRLRDDLLRSLGHLMLMGTSLFLLTTLDFTAGAEAAFLNGAFLRAAIIISALVAVSLDEDSGWLVIGYRYLAHWLILLVVLDQSMAMEHGQLVCTAIWGGYAIAVLVGGTVADSRQTTLVGFLTIVLTATKLIAFDMADTETIWRVAVFIGFGGALLLTSYLVPGLAGGSRGGERPSVDSDGSQPADDAAGADTGRAVDDV
ncbi:MAG: DUF2339 domain-containing protein [Myxococcota bacterium]